MLHRPLLRRLPEDGVLKRNRNWARNDEEVAERIRLKKEHGVKEYQVKYCTIFFSN